ncbi:hypothetical protein GGF46_003494 [Coemansia sp. RSA 552]|nr:hypothetical protein GGF46_003494 [Coemansia sp. RSA 552]
MLASGASLTDVRAEQRRRILGTGGRVLKFTNNGGKLYFRYYFPHPETLTWNKLTSGLRVLFSIRSTDLYIRYTDVDGSKITVNDNNGLRIMFDETKCDDVVRIEVVSSEQGPMDGPLSSPSDAASHMTMPMPMPQSGFPGMEPSRPASVLSTANAHGNVNPGPVPHHAQPPPPSAGPVHSGTQSYGLNASMATLPPPRPQQPLD